jgi:hypothetical protein
VTLEINSLTRRLNRSRDADWLLRSNAIEGFNFQQGTWTPISPELPQRNGAIAMAAGASAVARAACRNDNGRQRAKAGADIR